MAARPRIRKRAHFPPNLHEPRPGYFTWRDPRDGKTHVLGRISAAEAIHEAQQANVVVERGMIQRSLAERVAMGQKTMADLLDKMPTEGLKKTTLDARRQYDKAIRDAIGTVECAALSTKDVADLLEGMKDRGVMRMAQAVRSRLMAVCTKGMALGWMASNPAAVTEKVKAKVKRQRLSLEQFNAIRKKVVECAEKDGTTPWLENAMLLALVSGQDRSTVAAWERGFTHGTVAIVRRSKVEKRLAIPLGLRMDAIGMTLGEVIAKCKSTGIVSKYLLHHTRTVGTATRGDPIHLRTITQAFKDARNLVGITGKGAPSFHEIRSLAKRLYLAQGNVDTVALLGHSSQEMGDLYADERDAAPIQVKVKGL